MRTCAQVFEPGHCTPPHVHLGAHELFMVLAGSGEGFAGSSRFELRPGDCVVFPPGVEHGIDNLPRAGDEPGQRLFCLQMMAPNEGFVEFVQEGDWLDGLGLDDLCMINPAYC